MVIVWGLAKTHHFNQRSNMTTAKTTEELREYWDKYAEQFDRVHERETVCYSYDALRQVTLASCSYIIP